MNKPIWKNYAEALYNGDFVSIKTYSGYGIAMADPKAPKHLFAPDVSNETLGKAVLESLDQSRALSVEETETLRSKVPENYKDWIQKMMERYGYKTKNALFKKMKNCGIECHEGLITISPSRHEKLDSWSGDGFTEDDHVKIPADSPPAEIGAALRLAFNRCTGLGS